MFTIKSQDRKARTGILKVSSGKIKTPFFMPVATKASVKNLTSHDLEDTKTECIISNSYILSLKPGADIIHKQGGIHKFMKWDKGIFTDSGGFQLVVPSLKPEINDKGVRFRNPFTNQKELFTPERSMEVQIKINSDVAMAFDHVPFYRKDYDYQKEAVVRTNKWAIRCIKYHQELKDVYNIDQIESANPNVVKCLIWVAILTLMCSRKILRLVKNVDPKKAHLYTHLRWAKVFTENADRLLNEVLESMGLKLDMLTLFDIFIGQGNDPNKNRKRLMDTWIA